MNDSTDNQTDSDDTWFCNECGDSVWLDGSDASKTKVWVDSIGWLCGDCKETVDWKPEHPDYDNRGEYK